jgi:hypothetical protein
VFDVTGVDQKEPQPPRFQQFKQRDLVDPGGLHCHRVDPVLNQPIRQGVQVRGESAKTAHRFLISVRRYGDPDFPAADVYPGGVGMNDAQHVRIGLGFINSSLTFTTFALAHAHLLKDGRLAAANRLRYD